MPLQLIRQLTTVTKEEGLSEEDKVEEDKEAEAKDKEVVRRKRQKRSHLKNKIRNAEDKECFEE